MNGNTDARGTLTVSGTLAVDGEVRLGANNRFVGRMNTGDINGSGSGDSTWCPPTIGAITGRSVVAQLSSVSARGDLVAGHSIRAGNSRNLCR